MVFVVNNSAEDHKALINIQQRLVAAPSYYRGPLVAALC
jgi:hypothetical protein